MTNARSKTSSCFIARALAIGFVACASACGATPNGTLPIFASAAVPTGTPGGGIGASPIPTAAPTPFLVTATQPISLQIYSVYDNGNYATQEIFTETGTSLCVPALAGGGTNCTLHVPEGRLFFSNLSFLISINVATCPITAFQPYYFRTSSSAGYVPPVLSGLPPSPIDCSGLYPPHAACYNGAARQIVPNFPLTSGFVYYPAVLGATTITNTINLASAHSLNLGSNRLSVNDMVAGKRLTTSKTTNWTNMSSLDYEYEGTAGGRPFVDYSIRCLDSWYDPVGYTINLKIIDDDSNVGGPIDDFWSWKELP